MLRSDAYNKEVALARIKRLACSGLPLEPFARTILDELHAAVPHSPNRPMLMADLKGGDAFVCSSPDLVELLPAFQHHFVEHPATSGVKFAQDGATLRRILPRQTVWQHAEIARQDMLKMDGFNAVMRPAGWHHLLQIVFVEDHRFAGYVPLWRSKNQKDYTRTDVDFLRAASPHITHGLKVALLQEHSKSADDMFSAITNWNAGSILLDHRDHPIAIDTNARPIFEQIGGLDGLGTDTFRLPRIRDAFAFIAAILKDIFHDPDSGLMNTAPPVARVYSHWSGLVLKLHGSHMIGRDGREYTIILVERGETGESRRRRMIAR
jgi:hypothetical protein